MLAHEFRNMNETLRMIYELDELAFSVLSNSKCNDLDALAMLKLMEEKTPIVHKNQTITFNSTDEVKIDLSSMPQMIAFNNKKLT